MPLMRSMKPRCILLQVGRVCGGDQPEEYEEVANPDCQRMSSVLKRQFAHSVTCYRMPLCHHKAFTVMAPRSALPTRDEAMIRDMQLTKPRRRR